MVDEPVHDRAAEDQVAFAPEAGAGAVAEVEDAEGEVGGAEAGVAVLVAHAQQGGGAEVSAGAFAADGERVGAELALRVLDQPDGGGFAVVVGRRVGMFGREPVADGDDGLLGRLRAGPELHVLRVVAADHPAAAVDVEVDPAHGFGHEDADGDLAGRPGDGPLPRDVVEPRRGRAEHAALRKRVAQLLRLHLVPGLALRGCGLDHSVERDGLRVGLDVGHAAPPRVLRVG